VLAAGVLLFLAAACSTEGTGLPLAPQAGAELSRVPRVPSEHYRYPDPEYVEACLTLNSTVRFTIITVVVDVGNDGSTDHSRKYQLAAGQCIDVWTQGGSRYDAVRIDINTMGHEYTSHVVSVSANGGISTGPRSVGSIVSGLLVNGQTGSSVEFTII
jgi:hypothetical protein